MILDDYRMIGGVHPETASLKNILAYHGVKAPLRTVYEYIEHIGTGGGGLRSMYAYFIDEAAAVLNNEELKNIAGPYRALQQRWPRLAYPLKLRPSKPPGSCWIAARGSSWNKVVLV